MLQIWGRLSSINVRKVVWAAQEVGASFVRTDAGASFGIVDSAHYRSMNPNGLVPVLQDGAFTLWESNVIVRYLAATHPHAQLLPRPLAQRFEAEQWMDWQQTSANPAGRHAFLQLIRTPEAQRRPELLEQSRAAMEPLLTLLDRHLSGRNHLLGEPFTIADIALGCEVHRWFGLPQARPAWPHLQDWYARLLARPASRGVLDLQLS